jgi:hypothetical protein
MAHPLTGAGFDYYSKELYAMYYPEFAERWPGKVWSCHSMWFTIFGEHGLTGAMLWVILLGSSLLSTRQLRSYGKIHPEMSWVVQCTDMLQTALFAFMVGGTFLDVAYFDMFYFLVAVLIIVKEKIRRGTVEAAPLMVASGMNWSGLSPQRP